MRDSIWLENPKYPGYRFSPEGNILSLARYRLPTMLMKQRANRDGYMSVSLNRKSVFAHRAVAEIFLKKPIDSDDHLVMQVNHKNGVKHDNRVENLEWVTPSENQIHRHKVLGKRCAIGEASGAAKLTLKDVLEIRARLKSGTRGIMTMLAKEYGVTIGNIHAIKSGRSWNFMEANANGN